MRLLPDTNRIKKRVEWLLGLQGLVSAESLEALVVRQRAERSGSQSPRPGLAQTRPVGDSVALVDSGDDDDMWKSCSKPVKVR